MQIRLPRDRFMGLRQTISEWVKNMKDALDFGPEFPAAVEARHVMFAQESARLQHLLEETRKASQEKDELIARLRAAGAVTGNMIVDGPAYYIKKANTLDGPFCTSCFQRHHEITRIATAPKPMGTDETPADWVQCAKCQTPFRSDRIRQYLNPSLETGPGSQIRRIGFGKDSPVRNSTLGEGSSAATNRDGEPEPNPPQSQNSAMGSPSPNATCGDGEPKPASAQIVVSPQERDAPKPVKTARKPRSDPKRDVSRLGRASTGATGPVGTRTQPRIRRPKDEGPPRTKATDRSKPTP